MKWRGHSAVLEKEGDGFVAVCPELDVASQGDTVEIAVTNLREAVDLFLECASTEEISGRLHTRRSPLARGVKKQQSEYEDSE